MLTVNLYARKELPSHLRHLVETVKGDINVLVIENDGAVLDYYLETEMDFANASPLIQWISKAYEIGYGLESPSRQKCAKVAHVIAERLRAAAENAPDGLNEKHLIAEARKYDAVADRFLKGLSISVLHEDGNIIAFKVKGDGGYVYSLNSQGDTCTCHLGQKSTQLCWHICAVECWRKAYNDKRN
jgi:hypothetical protein